MVRLTDAGMVRDAGLIAAAQRVEHYEMAGVPGPHALSGNSWDTPKQRTFCSRHSRKKERLTNS